MVSCAVQKQQVVTKINEGIEGYIYKVSGNQMPMKGKPIKAKGKGMVSEIWIYKATTLQQVQGRMPLFNRINTLLAIKVKSDSTGYYQATLPAGVYSVFVKEGNQLFAAETDGQGILNPAVVTAGKITSRNITLTTGALY